MRQEVNSQIRRQFSHGGLGCRRAAMRQNPVACAVLLAALALLCGCRATSSPDAQHIWRFAIEEARGSVQDAYASKFKELIEAKSENRIAVKVYPYGTLGTSDQITELVHSGSIQLAMASPGHLGKIIPEVQVFLLHYLLSGDEVANNAALSDPELLAFFNQLYRAKGFELLAFYTEGEMVWTTRKPIRQPADFNGVKMRVMTSPLLLAAYDAYGASPTPLPYAEVYSALQLNMIDGQVNPIFAIQEMSFYEVTDYLIFPGHAGFVTSAAMSRNFFNKLAPGDRQMLRDTIAELQDYIFDTQRTFNRQRLDLIKERKPDIKLMRLDDRERAAFREASLRVRQQFIDDVGEGASRAVALLLAASERARATSP